MQKWFETFTQQLFNYFVKLFNNNDNPYQETYENYISNISYSTDDEKYKEGSYNFVINNFIFSCNELKLIVKDFIKEYPEYNKILDTTIYSDHWFKMPNEIKSGKTELSIHKIIKGQYIDFIPNLLFDDVNYYNYSTDLFCNGIKYIQRKN